MLLSKMQHLGIPSARSIAQAGPIFSERKIQNEFNRSDLHTRQNASKFLIMKTMLATNILNRLV